MYRRWGSANTQKNKKERKSSGFFYYYRRTPDRPYKAKHLHSDRPLRRRWKNVEFSVCPAPFCWLVWRHLIHAKTKKKQKATVWIFTLIRTQSIEMCVCVLERRPRPIGRIFIFNNKPCVWYFVVNSLSLFFLLLFSISRELLLLRFRLVFRIDI
jgi:hypothetical protein